MEQCSSSARHPTSRLSPRLAGGGTVLTKGLMLRPLVPSGAHPPAGRSKPLLSQAHCIAIRSFVLGRRRRPQGRLQGAGGLRALQLDPGAGPDGPASGPQGRPNRRVARRRQRAHKVPEAPAHRASVLAAVPAGAATLVVGRGGGIEPGLVACLPDADHNKMRAHGHASDLPERTPRDPSLHLTAPYAIPSLSCGNTLQPGAARGVASWPLPPDTEGAGGSTPPAPTIPALSRAFVGHLVLLTDRDQPREVSNGRRAFNCLILQP